MMIKQHILSSQSLTTTYPATLFCCLLQLRIIYLFAPKIISANLFAPKQNLKQFAGLLFNEVKFKRFPLKLVLL